MAAADRAAIAAGFLGVLLIATGTLASESSDAWYGWAPAKASAYERQVHDIVAEHCPDTGIRAVARDGLGVGVLGRVHDGQNQINVIEGLEGQQLKLVSLHECAHIAQMHQLPGPGDRERLDTVQRAVSGTVARPEALIGWEQNADCIAQLWGADVRGSGYGTECTKPALDLARSVLRGTF